MNLFIDPTIRVTPSWTDASKTDLVKDVHGLIAFRFALWVGGKEVDHLATVSGQAYNQMLMTCGQRVSGCGAPMGEGVYALGDPDATRRINWASGRVGDYSASFKAGLGPIWTGVHSTKDYPCSTTDFGIHFDWNADAGMPGTLGCQGLPCPGQSLAAGQRYVKWQTEYDVAFMVVDYGFGTVPRPATAGKPIAPPILSYTKIFANGGKVSAFRGGQPATAMLVRVDFHGGKIGVAVNGIQLPPDQIDSIQFVMATKAGK